MSVHAIFELLILSYNNLSLVFDFTSMGSQGAKIEKIRLSFIEDLGP